MQAGVFGLIDNTHPASTKFLDDAVVGDGLPDERVGARHSVAILECDRGLVNEPAHHVPGRRFLFGDRERGQITCRTPRS
jgi:hypothetical protein